MIRTGYLRWEIDVEDARSAVDPKAREVTFRARPSYRVVRVKGAGHTEAAERFLQGEDTYDAVLRAFSAATGGETDVVIPDVGPQPFRYSESDRAANAPVLDGQAPARGQRLRPRGRPRRRRSSPRW